jgi:glycosyltransferase involved in cell wall biosynthesis
VKAPHDPPRVAIVTPSLNQGEFIERTVRSVLDQRYPRTEYVIQDGGSTDATARIIDPYRPRLHHFETGTDTGQAAAVNTGHRRSSGEILSFLNADDVLLPGSLAYVASYFSTHPDVDVVYGHRVVIDAKDRELGRWILPADDPHALTWINFIPQETLFWRRWLWDAVGGLTESLRFALDWDLTVRFREAGAKFVRLPRFLGAFRMHGHQKLTTLAEEGAQEAREIRERLQGRPTTQAEALSNTWSYLAKHVVLHRLYRARLLRY